MFKGHAAGVAITILDHDYSSSIYLTLSPLPPSHIFNPNTLNLRLKISAKAYSVLVFDGAFLIIENELYFAQDKVGENVKVRLPDSKMSLDRVATSLKCIKFVLKIIIVANALFQR